MIKTARQSYDTKGQLSHVEKEQVDIKADIKIIQHDIVTIKENMAAKTDMILLKSAIAEVRSELKEEISSLGNKVDLIKSDIGWIKVIGIAILTTVLGTAFIPMAQNMFKAPTQEVIPDKK